MAFLLLQLPIAFIQLLLLRFQLQLYQLQALLGLSFLLFQLNQAFSILRKQALLLLQRHFQFSQLFFRLLPFVLQGRGLLYQALKQFAGRCEVMLQGIQFGTHQLESFPQRIHLHSVFLLQARALPAVERQHFNFDAADGFFQFLILQRRF